MMMTLQQSSFRYDAVHLLPGEQIGLHEHLTWELSHVVVGSGVRVIGNHTEPFRAGEVILIPPAIPHCWHFNPEDTDSGGRIANITLTFTDDLLERCVFAFPELSGEIHRLRTMCDAVKLEGEEAQKAVTLLEEMGNRTHLHRLPCLLRLLLLLAESRRERVVGSYRRSNQEEQRLEAVRTYVVCNARRNITLDDVARHVGMNRAAFCVFFKRTTGKTFITYLNEYRIEMACQLLLQRRLAVSEVCYHSGFNNVPYFNRLFKRLKGVSPGAYLSEVMQL